MTVQMPGSDAAAENSGPSQTHTLSLRVYYEDTDAAGIVYYANYLKFAERGRTEMMRALGIDYSRRFAEAGIIFIVRRLTADYRLPARLDDALTVETRIAGIGAATLQLDQQIRRDGVLLVALAVQLACVGRDQRPRRLPANLRAALIPGDRASITPPIVQKTP